MGPPVSAKARKPTKLAGLTTTFSGDCRGIKHRSGFVVIVSIPDQAYCAFKTGGID
jgi:hypothetical protein